MIYILVFCICVVIGIAAGVMLTVRIHLDAENAAVRKKRKNADMSKRTKKTSEEEVPDIMPEEEAPGEGQSETAASVRLSNLHDKSYSWTEHNDALDGHEDPADILLRKRAQEDSAYNYLLHEIEEARQRDEINSQLAGMAMLQNQMLNDAAGNMPGQQ